MGKRLSLRQPLCLWLCFECIWLIFSAISSLSLSPVKRKAPSSSEPSLSRKSSYFQAEFYVIGYEIAGANLAESIHTQMQNENDAKGIDQEAQTKQNMDVNSHQRTKQSMDPHIGSSRR